MDISENIKNIRERKKISQSDIAKALDTERTNYHRLEKRGDKLTIEQLKKIAEALGVTIFDLLREPREMQAIEDSNDFLNQIFSEQNQEPRKEENEKEKQSREENNLFVLGGLALLLNSGKFKENPKIERLRTLTGRVMETQVQEMLSKGENTTSQE